MQSETWTVDQYQADLTARHTGKHMLPSVASEPSPQDCLTPLHYAHSGIPSYTDLSLYLPEVTAGKE